MSNIIPFQFKDNSIRIITDEKGELWFVLADAYVKKRLNDDEVQAIDLYTIDKIEGIKINNLPPATKWMPESDVLKLVMRSNKTDAASLPHSVIQSSKEFRALYGIARLIGLDKNAAAIKANQGTIKVTGVNLLEIIK